MVATAANSASFANAPGTVLENLSSKKFYVLLVSLFLILLTCFSIGAFISPHPAVVLNTLFTPCAVSAKGYEKGELFYRHEKKTHLDKPCSPIEESQMRQSPDGTNKQELNLEGLEIVFVAEIPRSPAYILSPFHQFIIAIIDFQIQYLNSNQIGAKEIYLDVKLAARNDNDRNWTLLWDKNIVRPLNCEFPIAAMENDDSANGYNYDCVPQSLFQLGSTYYEHYLVNVHINKKSTSKSSKIGNLYAIMMPVIMQSPTYTKILFSIKSFFTPLVIFGIYWFWSRVYSTKRRMELMEKSIVFLGFTLLQLDFPIDWLSVFLHTPVILFLSDIRQGLFYIGLLSFWVIFTGEHLARKSDRNKLKRYKWELSAITLASASMLMFDLIERGAQIFDPFYTVWAASTGAYNAALVLIVAGATSGAIYCSFLFYLIFKVFQAMKEKKRQMERMSRNKHHIFEGVVFRFKFLMGATLVLASITIGFFVLVQVQESSIYFAMTQDYNVDAMFSIGVFAVWNIYAMAVMLLYAPSHRFKEDLNTTMIMQYDYDDEEDEDETENGMNFSDRDEGIVLRDTNVSFANKNNSSESVPGGIDDETEVDDLQLGSSSLGSTGTRPKKGPANAPGGSSKDVGKYENLGANPLQEPSLIYSMLGKENED